MRRLPWLLVFVLLCAPGAAAQTADPIVLCGCATSHRAGWDNPADCSQPLSTPDLGWSSTTAALADPASYFEHTFVAPAGSYRVWFRLRALNDSKWSDSIYVQYSDALNGSNQPVYRIGTTSALTVNLATSAIATSLRGWGWVAGAYWLTQTTTVRFAGPGPHTIRVQVREDGVSVDQIVLSAQTYRTAAPGGPTDDQTRFACPAPQPPPPGLAGDPAPAPNATNVPTNATLAWTAASDATGYDVRFGPANPPPVVSANQAALTYQPALAAGTTYYWSVDAKNAAATTPGALWSFTTANLPSPPSAPGAPASPAPADQATDVPIEAALTWSASTDATAYDVAFGSTNPPPLVSANQRGTSYQPSAPLAHGATFYWQVVAHGAGGSTAGPVWSFTSAAPPPPQTGDAPSVADTPLSRLRVVTWNIKQGYNLENSRNDYDLQIDLMASLAADVICLQEASLSDADMPAIILNGLSARTGRTWRGEYRRANAETAPRTNNLGSMILTWLPVDAISSTLFTEGLSQPFSAVHVQVTVNGTPVHVSTTHLYAWDAAVRAAQLTLLQTWLSAQGSRRVVAGDYNAFPFEATMWNAGWTTEYVDAWETATSWIQPTNDGGFTFDRRTATQNPERIDYHWTKGMTVSEMFVVKTRRSDHHAVVVDYKVP